MKRITLFVLTAAAILILIVACVKDLEKEKIFSETEITGVVVEKSENAPLADIKVKVTDGNRIHATAITGQDGVFRMKVNFEELNEDYYLLLDGSPNLPSKQEALRGMGNDVYDYKTLVLGDKGPIDMYNSLPTFTFTGHTYRVAPSAPTPLNFDQAKSYCDNLDLLYSDWRLPTLDELREMYLRKNDIGGFNAAVWWGDASHHAINFSNGQLTDLYYSGNYLCYVRPVRVEN